MNNSSETPVLLRWLKAFGHFWWDFLIGDTPELFIATLVILGVTALLAKAVTTHLAWIAMPPLVICAVLISAWRGRSTE